MATEQFANLAQTTLAANINAGATSLTVASNTNFPTTGQFRIVIDNEIFLVTSVSGTTFNVTPGFEGTAQSSHAGGAPVTHVLTAGIVSQLYSSSLSPNLSGASGNLPSIIQAQLRGSVGASLYKDLLTGVGFTSTGLPIYLTRDASATVSAASSATLTAQQKIPGTGTSTRTTTFGKQWFRWAGNPQNLIQYGVAAPDYNAVVPMIADNSSVSSGTNAQITVDSIVDCAAFEIPVKTALTPAIRVFINDKVAFDNSTDTLSGYPSGATFTYLKFTFAQRMTSRIRIEIIGPFYGVNLGSIEESISAAAARSSPLLISTGDSFSMAATNALVTYAYGELAGRAMGFEVVTRGSGGTGYYNSGPGGKMRYLERYAPPPATWFLTDNDAAHSGTYTITWNGVTTAPITYSSSYSTTITNVNAALLTAFGSDVYGRPIAQLYTTSAGFSSTGNLSYQISNRTAPAGSQPVFGNFTGTLTGYTVGAQYTGDLDPIVPKDGNGNALPFVILMEGGYNDTGASTSVVQALAAECWNAVMAKYPTAILIAMGPPTSAQSVSVSSYATLDAALYAQAQITLPKINGYTPYVSPWMTSYQGILQDQWTSGTDYVGNTSGTDGTNKWYTESAGVHWTIAGHYNGAQRLMRILSLFFNLTQ